MYMRGREREESLTYVVGLSNLSVNRNKEEEK